MFSRPQRVFLGVSASVALAAGAPPAFAHNDAPALKWKACGDAPNVQCTTVAAPLDYDHPNGDKVKLFVAKSPATGKPRLGSLFLNFGGPGASIADFIEAAGADGFPVLNEHFDLIGMDPRGVGQSSPAIDCKVNQETTGIYSEPFTTPLNLNANALLGKVSRYISRCIALNRSGILAHVSTANVARDMDLLRRALGEPKLNYVGFSYGTFLGATYASLFPRNYRAMVLDGAIDADTYINRPMNYLIEQSNGFERALGRFFQACAHDQTACLGFGGGDPWDEFDQLIDRANAAPIPAAGYTPDPRPIDGDDVIAAATIPMYVKPLWPALAQALAAADHGDGSLIRQFTDEFFYGRDPDTGQYSNGSDLYFTLTADEQRYTRDLGTYFDGGERSWATFDHFYWNAGYVELNYGLWPIHDRDAFYGPFHVPNSASTPLIVATTYDPATVYRGSLLLQRELGNARLLTMRGDGHTAYGNGSDCIDTTIERYVNTLALPPAGTSCKQNVPFEQSQAAAQQRALAAPAVQRLLRLHARPVL
jgi:pimeloyl-ACP methyl ester carboxylesterase